MTTADQIREKLIAAFQPTHIEVLDESFRHAGHSGARPEGESHFEVRIVSAVFTGVSRLERQRKIFAALDEEMKTIHALALVVRTPEEAI